MASVVMCGSPLAAVAESSASPKTDAGPIKVVDKDFGRLSTDGVSAFSDIHLARMAIFDGKTDEAAELVADAQVSLGKAKGDDTAFVKAESEFHTPGQSAPTAPGNQPKTTTPVAWIPIDGDLVLGETFKPTPEKSAAVVTARKGLEKGEGAKSLESIKIAAIDVDYTMAVVPLETSIADIDEANRLMTSHDYYGASQSLRLAEAAVRYDEIDDVANVSGEAKAVAGQVESSENGALGTTVANVPYRHHGPIKPTREPANADSNSSRESQ
jgi:hypothetical protein